MGHPVYCVSPSTRRVCAIEFAPSSSPIQLDVDDAAEGLETGNGGADFDDADLDVADDIVGVTDAGVDAALCALPTTLAVHLKVGRGVR